MTRMFSMSLCLVPRYVTSLVRLPTSDINCKSSMMYVLIHIHTHSIVDQIINGELCPLVYVPSLCLYYVKSFLGNASSLLLIIIMFCLLSRLVWLIWTMTGSCSLSSLEEMTSVIGQLCGLMQICTQSILWLCDLMDCLRQNSVDTSLIPRLCGSCTTAWEHGYIVDT